MDKPVRPIDNMNKSEKKAFLQSLKSGEETIIGVMKPSYPGPPDPYDVCSEEGIAIALNVATELEHKDLVSNEDIRLAVFTTLNALGFDSLSERINSAMWDLIIEKQIDTDLKSLAPGGTSGTSEEIQREIVLLVSKKRKDNPALSEARAIDLVLTESNLDKTPKTIGRWIKKYRDI